MGLTLTTWAVETSEMSQVRPSRRVRDWHTPFLRLVPPEEGVPVAPRRDAAPAESAAREEEDAERWDGLA